MMTRFRDGFGLGMPFWARTASLMTCVIKRVRREIGENLQGQKTNFLDILGTVLSHSLINRM